ncbi:MAG: hypothetical protein ABIL09_16405 [Gemmatimonadota bacterium]
MPPITRIAVHSTRDRVEAAGLKGQIFDHGLNGVDVFVGPNGAGKTTRLLAIVAGGVGIAGTPTDARRPYLESIPTETSVSLWVGDERLTRPLDASPRHAASKAADEAARQLLGVLPVSWDLSDWSSATAGQRARVLDAIARAGGAIEAWDVPRAQQEAAAEEGIGQWHEACVDALPSSDDGATWLASAITWTEAKRTEADRAAKDAHAAAKERRHEGQRPGGEQEDVQRRDELLQERARLQGTGRDRARVVQALEQYQRRGVGLEADMQRAVAEGQRLAQPLPEPERSHNPALREAMDRAEKALAAAPKVDLQPAMRSHFDAREALDAVRHELRAITSDERAAWGRLETLQAMQRDQRPCHQCGTADPLGIGEGVSEAERVHRLAREALEEAQGRLVSVQAADQQAEEALRQAEDRDRAHAQAVRDLDHARRALEEEGPAYHRARQQWQARERDRQQQLQQARQRWVALRDAHQAWQAEEPPVVPDEQDHAPRIAEIGAELAAIEERQAERREWDSARRASIEAAQRAERAQEAYDTCRAYLLHLRETRDRMAASAYEPIERAARCLPADGDGLPVPYFAGPDTYGADCGQGPIPYHDLSQSEDAITAAALVYALASVSKQPCKLVLLDGIEVVMRSRRPGLLSALARARQAGLVDTVVATMATDADEELPDVDGVTYHRLTRQDIRRPIADTARPIIIERAAVETVSVPMDTPRPVVADDDCPF